MTQYLIILILVQSSFSNFNKKLIYGNSYDFGDFDSCLTTKIDQSGGAGKYCMIKYHSDDAISVPPSENVLNKRFTTIVTNAILIFYSFKHSQS
jgi:hypothetical protein